MAKANRTANDNSGASRRRLLVAGAVVILVLAAAIFVIVVVLPKFTHSPQDVGDDVEGSARELELREESVEVARRLVADFPADAAALGLMGTVQNQLGNSAGAEQWWGKCLELHPDRADVYEALAVTYLTRGEFDRVIALSHRALAASPGMPGVQRYLAQAYLETGRLDEALAAIEREQQISPEIHEVYVVRGSIQLQRRAYEDAIRAYTRALELGAEDSRCYFGLSTAAQRLGQDARAGEYSAKFTSLRAVEDEAAEKKRRATEVIAPAREILAETLVDAGRVYFAYERIDRAQACWRRAVELAPSARNYFLLGQANFRLQDRAGALAAVKRASELEPDNEQIRKAYETLQQAP